MGRRHHLRVMRRGVSLRICAHAQIHHQKTELRAYAGCRPGGGRAIFSDAIGDEYLGALEKILLELKIDFIYEGERIGGMLKFGAPELRFPCFGSCLLTDCAKGKKLK